MCRCWAKTCRNSSMVLYRYDNRWLMKALLNLIVFERVNWMFAFFPGSFRMKSKLPIVAGFGPDWLPSLKNDWNTSNQASLQQLNWKACTQQGYLIWIREATAVGQSGFSTVRTFIHTFRLNIHYIGLLDVTSCAVKSIAGIKSGHVIYYYLLLWYLNPCHDFWSSI